MSIESSDCVNRNQEMIRSTLTATALALGSLVSTALAEKLKDSTIEYGNVSFTDPLISINYAQSWREPAEYALAITTKNPVKAINGQGQSTALLVNCKSGRYSVAFGYRLEQNVEETVDRIFGNFCSFHKKTFSHALW